VTTTGGRKVDVPVDLPDGQTAAIEVKMYQQYRTVTVADGSRTVRKVEVPLSSQIREQINKDVALRAIDPSYDPRWAFMGAGPNQELRDYLTKAAIIFTETRQEHHHDGREHDRGRHGWTARLGQRNAGKLRLGRRYRERPGR
jgi:hypothetical protein